MAWVCGSKPQGCKLYGRIICEAMYAINEREAAAGMSLTSWTKYLKAQYGGAYSIGTYPALDVYDDPVTRQGTLHYETIVDMQVAIEAIVAEGYYYNPNTGNLFNWNDSDADNLYFVAMGSGYDWVHEQDEMDGEKFYIVDIEEVLKCVELLSYTKVLVTDDAMVRDFQPDTNFGNYLWEIVELEALDPPSPLRSYIKTPHNGETNLFLYCLDDQVDVQTVVAHSINPDAWQENTITWNNQPSIGNLIHTFDPPVKNQWYSFPLGTSQSIVLKFAAETALWGGATWVSSDHGSGLYRPYFFSQIPVTYG